VGHLSKLIQRLSVTSQSNEGWGRRTIAEHSADGQGDNDYNHGQLVGGGTDGEIATKFITKDNQIARLKDDPPGCRHDGTSAEPGDGWPDS